MELVNETLVPKLIPGFPLRTTSCENEGWHAARQARNLRLYGRKWRSREDDEASLRAEKRMEDRLCASVVELESFSFRASAGLSEGN